MSIFISKRDLNAAYMIDHASTTIIEGTEGIVVSDVPLVVWGHGLTENKTLATRYLDWDYIRRHVRLELLRYDARGHGGTDSTEDPKKYSWDSLALDQLALVDQLRPNKPYICSGASMGCGTALYAALHAPERIKALILVIPPTGYELRPARVKGYERIAEIIEKEGTGFLLAASERQRVPGCFQSSLELETSFRKSRCDEMRPWCAADLARVFRGATHSQFPHREQIQTITCPTLILAWTDDDSHPTQTARELADMLLNVQLEIAETQDAFLKWSDKVVDFLTSLGDSLI